MYIVKMEAEEATVAEAGFKVIGGAQYDWIYELKGFI